jgi:hypothetical protein
VSVQFDLFGNPPEAVVAPPPRKKKAKAKPAPKKPKPPTQADMAAEHRRLNSQCAIIRDRLREGPATNGELSEIARKYTGRISDLRKAGYDIRVTQRNYVTGETTYTLFEKQ